MNGDLFSMDLARKWRAAEDAENLRVRRVWTGIATGRIRQVKVDPPCTVQDGRISCRSFPATSEAE